VDVWRAGRRVGVFDDQQQLGRAGRGRRPGERRRQVVSAGSYGGVNQGDASVVPDVGARDRRVSGPARFEASQASLRGGWAGTVSPR
jgi:hypothetical protein